MVKDSQQLSARLASADARMTPLAFEHKLRDWFKVNGPRMSSLIGSKQEAQKLLVVLLEVASRNPYLLDCDITSLGTCLLQSAQLNLYPGVQQECAYVPYKGKAQFQVMYQGICKLAYQSGMVRSIRANVVKEGDDFDWEEGTNQFLRHKPLLDESERGEVIAAWCAVEMSSGTTFKVVSRKFIDGIMRRSPAAQRGNSPWQTDYEQMAIKTVVKQALKTVPKSTSLAAAIAIDNQVERNGKADDVVIQLDAEKLEIDTAETEKKGEEK